MKVDNKIDGFHGSKEMLLDIVYPFNLNEIKNKLIMEVGSGSGRILKNLLKYNPKKIFGVEPSKAIEVAKKIILIIHIKLNLKILKARRLLT